MGEPPAPDNPPPLQAPLTQVYLYDEPDALGLDIADLGRYIVSVLPAVQAEVRRDFLTHHLAPYSEAQRETLGRELLAQFRRAHVGQASGPPVGQASLRSRSQEEPLEAGETTDLEFYDGRLVRELLGLLLPPEERDPGLLHLVFTNWRLALPNPEGDFFQALSLFSTPTLISLTGVLEALAPPREYDFLRAQLAMFGLEENLEDLDEQFAARLLAPGDPRLGEVLKGLVLQALFGHLWGAVSCPDPDCRLYNARTYEELLHAQTRPDAGPCSPHRAWLRSLGGAPERA